MRVLYFDLTDKLRHGNTEPSETLEALLASSDVVSLHVAETATADLTTLLGIPDYPLPLVFDN